LRGLTFEIEYHPNASAVNAFDFRRLRESANDTESPTATQKTLTVNEEPIIRDFGDQRSVRFNAKNQFDLARAAQVALFDTVRHSLGDGNDYGVSRSLGNVPRGKKRPNLLPQLPCCVRRSSPRNPQLPLPRDARSSV
jgi:hypothetical protein